MAEIATIARPYAEALFKASSSDLSGTAAWLDQVAAIAANPQLKAFADNPKATVDQVLGVIAAVASSPLSAAAEIQWDLLPPLSCSTDGIGVGGNAPRDSGIPVGLIDRRQDRLIDRGGSRQTLRCARDQDQHAAQQQE